MNDLMVEMTESFNVTLRKPASLDSRITLNPSQVDGVVKITDDDGIVDSNEHYMHIQSLPILMLELCMKIRKKNFRPQTALRQTGGQSMCRLPIAANSSGLGVWALHIMHDCA